MSKINYQELREAAEQATQDEWVAYILPGHNGIYPARTSEGRHCGYFIDWPGVCQGRESISIRTYAVNCNDAWLNTEGDDISGSYVKYKDHQEVVAALEAKCAALAVENAGLKAFKTAVYQQMGVGCDAPEFSITVGLSNLRRFADTLHAIEREFFTKERLLTIKQWRETYGPGSNVVLPAEEAEELARIALASLEAEPVAWMRDDADGREYNARNEFSGGGRGVPLYATPPAPVVPEEKPMPNPLSMYAVDAVAAIAEVRGWNDCRAAMLQSGNFRENKNSSTNNFREIAETSTNYPVIPSEVLSAIQKVAKIRADFDDFDGDRRGIGDCLDEAEQELIVTINKYASQLAAEPIATNDVREQTAVPPVPVIQADVAQAIEKLKRKLVECNRYNYCADAVKGVEYACHAATLPRCHASG